MPEIDYQKGKLLMKESPFLWKKDQTMCCENQNLNCTYDQIEKMKNKGLLNAVDFCIIRIMAGYRYLAQSHINACVSGSSLKEGYKKDSYDENIAKMVRAGIINRFCFVSGPGDLYECLPNHCSVRFYDLSKGAYSYARDVAGYKVHHLNAEQKQERVLELLSLNQFDIGMQKDFKECIRYRGYAEKRKLGSSYAELDLYYRIQRSATTLPLHLYVVSVRLYPGYENRFAEKIRIVRSCVQMHGKDEPTIVLVLCENMDSVKIMYKHQELDELLRNEVILYTTDITNYVFGAMSSIMTCKNIGDNLFLERLKLI